MWINEEHEPRWEGPPLRWCDAKAHGQGVQLGHVVTCNSVLRDDGTCRRSHNHVTAS